MLQRTDIFPCTPAGILRILDSSNISVSGLNVVIVGRSFIVGKPLAAMFTNRNATVTLCHSKTKNLSEHLIRADIIVAAVGKPGMISAEMVREGAILIDVGMNYLSDEQEVMKYCSESQKLRFKKKRYAITGDISQQAFEKSSYYTPVPGGIGRMTVAMLMEGTLKLFKKYRLKR
jgi:5,10-methylene-tetrahydrofolate dehydrogenase/methenyl tetrahydrofolate cyclohydrolase